MAGMEVRVVTTRPESDDPYAGIKPFLSMKLLPVAFAAMMVTWSFGWLYIGETWDPISKMTNMQIGILNCDTGIPPGTVLPPAFANTTTARILMAQPFATSLLGSSVWNQSSPANTAFFWLNFTCDLAPQGGCGAYPEQCYQQAVDAISDAYYWNILYFPPNYTVNYLSWFVPASGITGVPDASPILTYNIYGRGRSYTTYSFLLAYLQGIWAQLQAGVFAQIIRFGMAYPNWVQPGVYTQPMALVAVDLHPVAYFGENFASYVFCILLWLGATFCVAVFNQFKTPSEIKQFLGGTPTPWEQHRDLGLKALFAMLYTWILSVLMTLILFALGQGRTAWNKNAGYCMAFGWWLSFCFIAINAFLLHALGPERFSSMSAFLLVLQLTSGGAIMSEQLSNNFFMIGRGLPFYYGVRGFRTIFFGGLENVMYVNWLVIFAWNMVSVILTFFFIRARMFRQANQQAKAAKQASAETTVALSN